ncbi:hypothetical protein [Streptomyces sp. NPDC058964]|uniref:hypothetical protein n=1 Tax=Streptomyces sp. NPDC058964 TaxID=3346681 RepID=UPI0036C1EDE1
MDPPAFLERPRTLDPVVVRRLMGRECFLINTAEAAMQVLVLQQVRIDKDGPFTEGRRCRG